MSKVYFVGTPIGNLGDITVRALETLREVDFIACEDTRHSKILLNHYEISKPTFSYHKFNEKTSASKIVDLVRQGKSVAVISDAGMPSISDPGFVLVGELVKAGLSFEIIPGPSAVVTALVGSGLNTQNFVFGGFLPDKKTERVNAINTLANAECTVIFYSADHDLNSDLRDCASVLGHRRVVVANDLTKKFEAYFRGYLDEIEIENPRGEFVILIEGKAGTSELNSLDVNQHIAHYINAGVSRMEALKLVAKDRGVSKSVIYAQAQDSEKTEKITQK